MFYKFNSFTGRLSQSTPLSAYYPQGLNGPAVAEPSTFQFDSSKTRPVEVVESVNVVGEKPVGRAQGAVPASSGYKKVMSLQKAFSVQDGLMVWQKRGILDRAPTWITFAIMGVSTYLCFNTIYRMTYQKKN